MVKGIVIGLWRRHPNVVAVVGIVAVGAAAAGGLLAATQQPSPGHVPAAGAGASGPAATPSAVDSASPDATRAEPSAQPSAGSRPPVPSASSAGRSPAATGSSQPPAVPARDQAPAAQHGSSAERAAAQAAVDRARSEYRGVAADANATSADRDYAHYRLDQALQDQANLLAGRPGYSPRILDIERAQASLDLAQQSYRQALANSSATAADREAALSLVRQWQERLAAAQTGR